jgi:hypothetical protein
MVKEIRNSKFTILFGCRFTAFGIGFHIDKWTMSIDLGPFWIGIEW